MIFVILLIVTGPEVKMVTPILTTIEDVIFMNICVELTGSGYILGSDLNVTLTDIGTPNTMCM